jgi:hypothetical protein
MQYMKFADLCRALDRPTAWVRGVQRRLDLHRPENEAGYSTPYLVFLEKVLFLRALHVPEEDIAELFETEKKILRLQHVDTLTRSPTWYLDACESGEGRGDAGNGWLLLSGYCLGFPLDADTVQPALDFGERSTELFPGREMGEDVRRLLKKYREHHAQVRARIARERPVLEAALRWAGKAVT